MQGRCVTPSAPRWLQSRTTWKEREQREVSSATFLELSTTSLTWDLQSAAVPGQAQRHHTPLAGAPVLRPTPPPAR